MCDGTKDAQFYFLLSRNVGDLYLRITSGREDACEMYAQINHLKITVHDLKIDHAAIR